MKIYISPLDALFSKVIRMKAGNKCERCLKYHEWKDLQCAHFIGRANKKVRWDLSNACALCYGCHQYLDSRFIEKFEFVEKYLGKTEYEKLKQRANWPSKKIDQKMIEIVLKARLKEYELV